MKKVSLLCVLSCIIDLSLAQTNLPLLSSQTCAGKTNSIDCGKNNVVLISEAVHGVRAVNEGQCEYTPGDCTQLTTTNCGAIQTCATLLTSNTSLSNCGNQKAQYLTKRYYCPPISGVTQYEICSTSEITATSGSILSPNYPKYAPISSPCVVKLVAPEGKTFNIYPADVSLAVRNSDDECSDYVKIIDTTGEKILCARERESFANKFCSNVIYITYSAITPQTPILSTYKGFNFYFEVSDQSPNSGCPTETPPPPTFMTTTTALVSTTTTITTTPPVVDPTGPVVTSPYISFQICKGKSAIFTADDNALIYIELINYRVQFIQFACQPPATLDCVRSYVLECNLKKQCEIKLNANTRVPNCMNKNADSLTGIYRSVPIDSTAIFYMCTTTVIDADTFTEGVIFSRNYPILELNSNCLLTIQSSNPNKAIRFYLTDIYMDSNCIFSYVQVSDNTNKTQTFCQQSIDPNKSFHFHSCSNSLYVTYRTREFYVSNFRGFRAYFELTDRPEECDPTTTRSTTITTRTTTKPTTTTTTIYTTISTTTNTTVTKTTSLIYTDESILTEESTVDIYPITALDSLSSIEETITNRFEKTTADETIPTSTITSTFMTTTTVLSSTTTSTTTSIFSTNDLSTQFTTTQNIPTNPATTMTSTSKDEESIEVLSIGAILGIAIGSAVIVSAVVSGVVFVAVYYLCIRTPKKVSPTNDIQMT